MKDLTCCRVMIGNQTSDGLWGKKIPCGNTSTRWFISHERFVITKCQKHVKRFLTRRDYREITYEEALVWQVMHS